MNTEFKPIEIIEHNWAETSIYRDGISVCTLSIEDEATEETQEALEIIMDEDAKVIADALTAIQSCGLLPSELLKQRDEIKEMLKEALNHIEDVMFGDYSSMLIRSFVEKTESFIESTEVKHKNINYGI